MKNKNKLWIIGGVINLITAIIHLVGGQIDNVNPLLLSNLTIQEKAEWVSVWHMVSIILFVTSYILIKSGMDADKVGDTRLIRLIGNLYLLFCLPFVISSIIMGAYALQWILLLPIGLLAIYGVKKSKRIA